MGASSVYGRAVFVVGALLMPISLVFFTMRSGLEVDFEQMRYRRFNILVFVRVGKWKPVLKVDHVQLNIFAENAHSKGVGLAFTSMPGGSSKTILYSISLVRNRRKPQEVFKFKTYRNARANLDAISAYLEVGKVDKVEEKIRSRRR